MIKVLIIDDDKSSRLIYRHWLDVTKVFEVIEAINAEEGFVKAKTESPRCILMDHFMVGMNGFAMLHRMKKELNNCPPIIFITCALSEDLRRNALALGACACVDKSKLDGADLVHLIIGAVIGENKPTDETLRSII